MLGEIHQELSAVVPLLNCMHASWHMPKQTLRMSKALSCLYMPYCDSDNAASKHTHAYLFELNIHIAQLCLQLIVDIANAF